MKSRGMRYAHQYGKFALGVLGSGITTTTASSWFMHGNEDNHGVVQEGESCDIKAPKKNPRQLGREHADNVTQSLSTTKLLATSATINADIPAKNDIVRPSPQQQTTMEYDFVILGNGNSGLSAVRTLREKCPSAKIALVDPMRPISSKTNKLDYWPHFATGFDPLTRTVQLSDDTHQLRYSYGILVATGSRGAPPPPSLLDDEAMDRVFELRSTTCIHTQNDKRPAMSPNAVRQMTLMAASQGARVAIMGSGWEAVELAVAAAKQGKGSSNNKPPMLTFGGAGPLSHILPRYLCTAVTKRLRQQGVDVQSRTLVRYVALDQQRPNKTSQLEVHTAKSYDMLDTKRTPLDLLVVAPYIDGPRGTAFLPTLKPPTHLHSHVNAYPWFQSWSQLTSLPTDSSLVVCFDDDGRIMVNAELQAASRVYAAGSVAKYPNSTTGLAHVAGEGSEDGANAGRVAALHMAEAYMGRETKSVFSGERANVHRSSFAAESFPISRSDLCKYLHGGAAKSAYLGSVGVSALCVGECDSERMSTHGFWWTNQSAERALEQAQISSNGRSTLRRTRTSKGSPVYGIGVVYYLDRRGRIRGIMTWGLPFTAGKRNQSQELNEALVSRMKDVIRTNGGVSQWEAEENAFLHSFHLSEESKKLVALSLSKGLSRRNTSSNMQRLMVPIDNIGKPLHRYTAAKPSSITGLQTLKRKDHAKGDANGEKLFVKDEDEDFESLRPPTLLYVYPMHDPKQPSGEATGVPFHKNNQERLQRSLAGNEDRARPSKEEPLWLRRGDAQRATSQADMLADLIMRNISKGKFADGSDALEQAPVPKSVVAAKETIAQWMNAGDSNDTEDGSRVTPKDDRKSDQ